MAMVVRLARINQKQIAITERAAASERMKKYWAEKKAGAEHVNSRDG